MGAYLVEPDAWPPLLSASNSLELKTWPPWDFGVSCTGSARWWGVEKYQWNLPMSRTGLRLSPVLLQRLHSESLLRDVAVLGTDVITEFLMGMFSADKWLSFRAGTGDLHSQRIMVWFLQWNILWRWKLWHLHITISIEPCMIMAAHILQIFICISHKSVN